MRRAQLLADEGREDSDAVADLGSIAGRHLSDARSAALWFAEDGWSHESRCADRAYRLLMAVADKNPVSAPSPEALRRFDRVDAFLALPRDEAFDVLMQVEPRLAGVAETAKSGGLGHRVDLPEVGRAHSRQERDELLRHVKLYERSMTALTGALDHLVGPSADGTDELLRTNAARDVAESYVDDLRPKAGSV